MLTGCISLFPGKTKLSTQALMCTYLLMAFLTFLSRVEKEIRADVETLLCCFHLIESCAGFIAEFAILRQTFARKIVVVCNCAV